MRALLATGLLCALLVSACGTAPAGSGGGVPAAPARTAAPVIPAAGTLAPAKSPAAPSAMPSDDPYGYGY